MKQRFIPKDPEKSVFGCVSSHCLCARLHHPTCSSWVASAPASLAQIQGAFLPNFRFFWFFGYIPLLLFLVTAAQATDDWQSLPQPIGTLNDLWLTESANSDRNLPVPVQGSAPDLISPPVTGVDEVNYICAQWDLGVSSNTLPFDPNVTVTEISPTQTMHFVRFYLSSGGSTKGPWLAPSSQIRGLTPTQIKAVLALENTPDSIVSVDIPAGSQYGIWTGIANPIWGQPAAAFRTGSWRILSLAG